MIYNVNLHHPESTHNTQNSPDTNKIQRPYSQSITSIAGEKIQPQEAVKNKALSLIDYKKRITNAYDDADGILFSHFLNILQRTVDQTIDAQQNENIPSNLKSEILALIIKTEIQKYYKDNSYIAFLASFQICTELPALYIEPVWNFLSKDFKNHSFKDISLIAHVLHELALVRRKPFDYLVAFLNIFSYFRFMANESFPQNTEKALIEEIDLTVKLGSRIETTVICNRLVIHVKNRTCALTLEVPIGLELAIKMFETQFNPSDCEDLILFCIPQLQPCNQKEQHSICKRIEKLFSNLCVPKSLKELNIQVSDMLQQMGKMIALTESLLDSCENQKTI